MPATVTKPKRDVKSRALKLVREMPEGATWDDLMYSVYVRQKIEAGLADLKDGRKHTHEDIRRRFGLSS